MTATDASDPAISPLSPLPRGPRLVQGTGSGPWVPLPAREPVPESVGAGTPPPQAAATWSAVCRPELPLEALPTSWSGTQLPHHPLCCAQWGQGHLAALSRLSHVILPKDAFLLGLRRAARALPAPPGKRFQLGKGIEEAPALLLSPKEQSTGRPCQLPAGRASASTCPC